MNEFWLHLHWTLFLWVLLTIWHYLNQWWLVYWRISEPMMIGLQTHISASRPQWVNCVLISAYLSGASNSINAYTILGHMYAVAETIVQLLLRMTLNIFCVKLDPPCQRQNGRDTDSDSKVYGANMGPPGSCRHQMGLMLASRTLLSWDNGHITIGDLR